MDLSTLAIDTASFDDVMDMMRGDTEEHWKEVPFGAYTLELNLNEEVYKKSEQDGHARYYIAMLGTKPVAYMSIFASDMIQHKGTMQAVTDAFYVAPAYRKSGVFAELLKHVEQDLASHGIRFFTVATNPMYKGGTEKLLEVKGYSMTEIAYTKELK